MKQRLIIIIALVFTALGTLYALDKTSNAPNRHPNGFKRKFLDLQATITAKQDYDMLFRELSGQNRDSLFMMTGIPGKVFVTKSDLKYMRTIEIEDPKIPFLIPRFYTMISYPQIHILGGNSRFLAVGNLKTGSMTKIAHQLNGTYNTPVILKDGSFVMQVIDSTTLNARFVRIDNNGIIIVEENGISKPLEDAGMIHSGMLKYDSTNNQLVYMHFYDNHFEVFNPDLKLLYRSNTIDTNYSEKIEILKSGKSIKYKKPPVAINAHADIFEGNLYVRSKLVADNENHEKFWNNTVIDQYDLNCGKYVGSFYLPNVGDKQISQFYFLNSNQVLAIYKNMLIVYQLTKHRRSLQRPTVAGSRPETEGKTKAVITNM